MMRVVLGWELAVLPWTRLISICTGLCSRDSCNIFGETLLVRAKLISLLECWVPLVMVGRVSRTFCTVVTFKLNKRLCVVARPSFVLQRFDTFPLFIDASTIDSQASGACYVTISFSHALLVQNVQKLLCLQVSTLCLCKMLLCLGWVLLGWVLLDWATTSIYYTHQILNLLLFSFRSVCLLGLWIG